jgi:thiamine phosphate synthase YjbQ (UPF0047 family)
VGYRHEHIDDKCGFPSQSSAVRSKRNPAYSRRKVELGTWQRIFFAEMDEPRSRTVNIMLLEV